MGPDEVEVDIETTEELPVAVETGRACCWRSVIWYAIPVCVLFPFYAIGIGAWLYVGLTTEPREA